jgi:hypothetical protein
VRLLAALLILPAVATGLPARAAAQSNVAHELSVAACVVDNDGPRVRSLLRTVSGSPAEAKSARLLMRLYGACDDNKRVSGALRWRERAAIAHAAAVAELEGGRGNILAASALTASPAMPGVTAVADRDYSRSSVGMLQAGICVVRAAPDASLALLRSEPGSGAEVRAIRAVTPALSPCVTGGQQFKLKRADLRLIVAEPLYEILTAGSAGAQR